MRGRREGIWVVEERVGEREGMVGNGIGVTGEEQAGEYFGERVGNGAMGSVWTGCGAGECGGEGIVW